MIPKTICLTWETKNFELESMTNAVNSWKTLNPSFDVNVFDKFDRENLVKEIDIVNKAYHIVDKNSAKADIWRLLHLYKYGGFYTDIDQICLKSISDYIEDDIEFVISTHSNNPRSVLQNGFIGTVSNNPMIKYLLEGICNNVINLNNSNCESLTEVGHYITGPYILPKILNKWLNRDENTKFSIGRQILNGVNMLFIEHVIENGHGIHYKINNEIIIKEKYDNYNNIRTKYYEKSNKKYCLLLTTFNIPTRTEMYNNTLNWWLENSDLDIFIVSSHINNFKINNSDNIKRVNIHLFNQPEDILLPDWHKHKPTSTEAEIISISEIYTKFKYKLLKYQYIIKLTGKYRVPEYVDVITNLNTEFDIARQGYHYRGENIITNNIPLTTVCHTETYIIRSSLFENLLENISTGVNMESRLAKFINEQHIIIYNLPPLKIPIDYRVKRNDDSILECL